jgi:hypothetical protein
MDASRAKRIGTIANLFVVLPAAFLAFLATGPWSKDGNQLFEWFWSFRGRFIALVAFFLLLYPARDLRST